MSTKTAEHSEIIKIEKKSHNASSMNLAFKEKYIQRLKNILTGMMNYVCNKEWESDMFVTGIKAWNNLSMECDKESVSDKYSVSMWKFVIWAITITDSNKRVPESNRNQLFECINKISNNRTGLLYLTSLLMHDQSGEFKNQLTAPISTLTNIYNTLLEDLLRSCPAPCPTP
ncbi:hypothetical protein NEOKW01_1349 [Nematocida sp. AWRm80]|nr:hypothetical protein NEOKW01_1349 [Nematocida sp. AWRm80]